MRISTRGHYGLRMMLEMAKHQGEGLVKMSTISESFPTPPKYLHNLLGLLKAGGLVRAQAGKTGGYALTREPSQIRVSEIVNLLEGLPTPVSCVRDGTLCPRSEYCAARTVWCEISEAVEKVLEGVTLADLVAREHDRKHAALPCNF
jgi:Rrf2 family transcriptional regulator, cysteine metabolism repressor